MTNKKSRKKVQETVIVKAPVDEIIQFVRRYGKNADHSSDEILRREVEWYTHNDRALVVRDKLGIGAVVFAQPIASPNELSEDQWPKDCPTGEYLYVGAVVIHPIYRSLKMLLGLLAYAKQLFPSVKYVIYRRGAPWELHTTVVPIDILRRKGEMING